MAEALRIGFVAFPGLTTLDLTGPYEVFAAANELNRAGRVLYKTVIVAERLTPVLSDSGIAFLPHEEFATAGLFDTVITPGGPGLREPATQAQVAAWLKQAAPHTRRLVSVCTGVYGLAATELLDGRRAATHWRHAEDAARQFPKVTIDARALYHIDRPFYTSAGITAGIDLALALVEEDHGSALALAVARELVVYLKRPGGQTQFSDSLQFQTRATDRFAELAAWLPEHLPDTLTIESLAKRTHSSPRNFARRFKDAFGTNVGEYVETLRLNAARERLGAPDQTLESIALSVGFRSADVFRRAFERRFGVSPKEYASHFAGSGGTSITP
jgi:transcriptional regulator GlxA family with amidase domain